MQTLTNEEITAIEARLGVRLPGLYHKLLVEEGHGSYGQRSDCKWNTAKEIYHPEAVRTLYAGFFDCEALLFAPYFPFGCDHEKQVLWVIDSAKEKAASIWHETHPDDWSEERWVSYADWVTSTFDEDNA